MSQEAKDQEKPDPSDEMDQGQEQAEDVAATQQGPVGRFQTARRSVGSARFGQPRGQKRAGRQPSSKEETVLSTANKCRTI